MSELKMLIISVILLLTGCADKAGECVELTDGSGRFGIYIDYKDLYSIIRMTDTKKLETYFSGSNYIFVDQKFCEINGDE